MISSPSLDLLKLGNLLLARVYLHREPEWNCPSLGEIQAERISFIIRSVLVLAIARSRSSKSRDS
jgi:hypothetical protein